MTKFRPQKQVLDIFWTLSDGNDDQRNIGAVKLARIIKSEESEKEQLLHYCQERLIRGLSSGRKFARIGFSVALVQLLRENEEMDTSSVLSTIKAKLKIGGPDKKLQSEVGGIYLGKAFAISALIQANRIDQVSGDVLSSLVEELFSNADKKSYLRPVCDKIVQDFVQHIPVNVFEEQVWPKIKDRMSQGWQLCTLERVAVLLTCRGRFPEVVTKKFLQKHWGFPVLSEANDDKLLTTVLASVPQSDILVKLILPEMLEDGRDALSIWMNVGEKLLEETEKSRKTMAQRQLLGLKLANALVSSTSKDKQIIDIMLSPRLARCVFNSDTKRGDPSVAAAVNYLYEKICQRFTSGQTSILSVIERIWKLEVTLTQQAELVKSSNVLHFLDLMSQVEAEQYSHVLIAMVMGDDKWNVMSQHSPTKLKQIECCLRHLQLLSSCQSLSLSQKMQNSILALFLRLAFFHVCKSTKKIEHCEGCINLEETDTARRLSETFFYKTLNSIFSVLTGQDKKLQHLAGSLDMLYQLACYLQVLLNSKAVVAIKLIVPQMQVEWKTLVDFCAKIRQTDSECQELQSAFLLLTLFLGFYMLTDVKMAVDMLQDVYICWQKVDGTEGKDMTNSENEHNWIEVLTDMLLKIMSVQSHLGRVIAVIVFRLLSGHVTPNAVTLITEVLIPSKSVGDETILIDADDDDDSFHDGNEDDSADSSADDDESEDEDLSDHTTEIEASYKEEEVSIGC